MKTRNILCVSPARAELSDGWPFHNPSLPKVPRCSARNRAKIDHWRTWTFLGHCDLVIGHYAALAGDSLVADLPRCGPIVPTCSHVFPAIPSYSHLFPAILATPSRSVSVALKQPPLQMNHLRQFSTETAKKY
jgi:hypothetical protein